MDLLYYHINKPWWLGKNEPNREYLFNENFWIFEGKNNVSLGDDFTKSIK